MISGIVQRGSAGKNHENYNGRFPEGVQKTKSNNGDKHGHGQEKETFNIMLREKYKACRHHSKWTVTHGSKHIQIKNKYIVY